MPTDLHPAELKVEEWIRKAHDDELSINAILKDENGSPTTACFLAQQIAEKLLKAFLVDQKQWFPKIHNLDSLWELCKELDASFEEIKTDCITLTDYYADTRYPGDLPDFTWDDARTASQTATRIKQFIIHRISTKS